MNNECDLELYLQSIWLCEFCVESFAAVVTLFFKIVIYLFEKYITKNEKQWLENENYLFSEFLQKVKALKSQLQKKYNQYKLNLHSKRHISTESDEYVKLILSEEF